MKKISIITLLLVTLTLSAQDTKKALFKGFIMLFDFSFLESTWLVLHVLLYIF